MVRRNLAPGLLLAVALFILGGGIASSAPGANLQVTLDVLPLVVDPGNQFNASFSVQNLGDDPANTISINGTVPANTTFVRLLRPDG